MLFTQTIKSQNVDRPHSSGEETLWHNGRTCPDSGQHCGIGSHCLTDSCRKNEEEEEEKSMVSGASVIEQGGHHRILKKPENYNSLQCYTVIRYPSQ